MRPYFLVNFVWGSCCTERFSLAQISVLRSSKNPTHIDLDDRSLPTPQRSQQY